MAIVASAWQRRLLTLRRTKGSNGTDMSSSITIEANVMEVLGKADSRPAKKTGMRSAQKHPHVVAILPRGEAIRNFVYTGALDEVARYAELSVLSVFASEELDEN